MRCPWANSGPVSFPRRGQAKERPDVIDGDVIQIAGDGTEAEGHEAPESGLAKLHRSLAQSLLLTHPVAVCGREVLQGSSRRGRRRHWRVDYAGTCEPSGEPRDAPLPLALFVDRPQFGNPISKYREHGCVDLSCPDLAEVDLCDESVYSSRMPADRMRGIAELIEFAQVGVTVRRQPARTIASHEMLVVDVRRHGSLLSCRDERSEEGSRTQKMQPRAAFNRYWWSAVRIWKPYEISGHLCSRRPVTTIVWPEERVGGAAQGPYLKRRTRCRHLAPPVPNAAVPPAFPFRYRRIPNDRISNNRVMASAWELHPDRRSQG